MLVSSYFAFGLIILSSTCLHEFSVFYVFFLLLGNTFSIFHISMFLRQWGEVEIALMRDPVVLGFGVRARP